MNGVGILWCWGLPLIHVLVVIVKAIKRHINIETNVTGDEISENQSRTIHTPIFMSQSRRNRNNK